MKLVIVESNAENQAEYTRRINNFDSHDVEIFDLKIFLATEADFDEQVRGKDVMILGSGLREKAVPLARKALTLNPGIRIIMFVADASYSVGSLRSASAAGVHKVLPFSAPKLDFLQELISIFDSLRRSGAIRVGRSIAFLQAKGGTGVTTLCAALADFCEQRGTSTLLWDFDIETADLCRCLSVSSIRSAMAASLLDGSIEISKDSIRRSVSTLTENLFLLPPPRTSMADALDLVCHTESISVCTRLAEFSKSIYNAVLIDTAGRLGPATCSLASHADHVVVVIDDTMMGLTGVGTFLEMLQPLLSYQSRLLFLVNGGSKSSLPIREARANLESMCGVGESAWVLPAVPIDRNGSCWAGSGKTLYSLGSRETKVAIQQIAEVLEIGS